MRSQALLASALALAFSAAQFLPPLKQKILLPSYWAPCHNASDPAHGAMSCDWDQVESDEASHQFSAIGNIILNPDSGPGAGCSAAWLNITQRVRNADANMGIIGYSHTSYGQRPLDTVKAEIDTYFSCYPPPLLTGIFLDEASGNCTDLPYYAQLYAFIKGKGLGVAQGAAAPVAAEAAEAAPGSNQTVVLNPGWASDECYMAASDVLVTFEGSYGTYQGYTPAAWTDGYEADRFAHIVYNASLEGSEHLAAFRLSKTRHAGHVYITDLSLPNPYASLPTPYIYWDQEVRWAVNII